MIIISGLEPKHYSVTTEGFAELREQLEDLRRQRKDVAEDIRETGSQNTDTDALEDSALTIKKNQAIELDGQIVLLERIIGLANIVEKPKRTNKVQLGSMVVVELDGQQQSYRLVGPIEADPSGRKISNQSPLGQSLQNKKVGDTVEIVTPAGTSVTAVIRQID